jgi:hypothetical protein
MSHRAARSIAVLAAAVVLGGCATRAYVGLTPGEGIREVDLDNGTLTTLRPSHAAAIVGLAYEERTDRLFARLLPGTLLLEIDRRSSIVVRSFNAQQVPAGCGGVQPAPELPNAVCGLAMRAADRHLFLDHPSGNPITELTVDGAFVRHIPLKQPGGPIGGLAFDDDTGRLYVLYATGTVAEVDLDGAEIRRFRPQGPIEPLGLDYDRHEKRFLIPLAGGNRLGAFDSNGALRREYPLQRAGTAGGVASGRIAWWRQIVL